MLTGPDEQIQSVGTEQSVAKPSTNTAQDQQGNSTTHSKELSQAQREMMWCTQKQQLKQGFETGKENIVCCTRQTENGNLCLEGRRTENMKVFCGLRRVLTLRPRNESRYPLTHYHCKEPLMCLGVEG